MVQRFSESYVPPQSQSVPPPTLETKVEHTATPHPSHVHNQAQIETLLRRWNTQVTSVGLNEHPSIYGHGLQKLIDDDPDQEFNPEKLRDNLERCYLTFGKALGRAVEEIGILRSWEDPIRTGTWCTIYFIAWYTTIGVVTMLLSCLILAILFPDVRTWLFPAKKDKAASLRPSEGTPSVWRDGNSEETSSAADHKDSKLQNLDANIISLQEEQKAAEFSDGIVRLARVCSTGNRLNLLSEENVVRDNFELQTPPKDDITSTGEENLSTPEGIRTNSTPIPPPGPLLSASDSDSTPVFASESRPPVSATAKASASSVKKYGLPIQKITGDLSTVCERLHNALSLPVLPPSMPSSRFALYSSRIRIASYLFPILIAIAFVNVEVWRQLFGAVIGLVFFGQPFIKAAVQLADKIFGKGWAEVLEVRYSFLLGVPSSMQLTIALMRDAEAIGCPLPPVSRSSAKHGGQLNPALRSNALEAKADDAKYPPLSIPQIASDKEKANADVALAGDPVMRPSDERVSNLKEVKGESVIVKTNKRAKFASFLNSAARWTEQGAGYISGQKQFDWEGISRVAVDKLVSATGSNLPEHLMLVVPNSFRNTNPEVKSNSTFYAHRASIPGHLLLHSPIGLTDTKASIFQEEGWTLEFVRIGKSPLPKRPKPVLLDAVVDRLNTAAEPELIPNPASLPFKIPVSSIISIRKSASMGIGWKSKIAAEWILDGTGVGDGLCIRWRTHKVEDKTSLEADDLNGTRDLGARREVRKIYVEAEETFTAILRRDELFNRIVGLASFEGVRLLSM